MIQASVPELLLNPQHLPALVPHWQEDAPVDARWMRSLAHAEVHRGGEGS